MTGDVTVTEVIPFTYKANSGADATTYYVASGGAYNSGVTAAGDPIGALTGDRAKLNDSTFVDLTATTTTADDALVGGYYALHATPITLTKTSGDNITVTSVVCSIDGSPEYVKTGDVLTLKLAAVANAITNEGVTLASASGTLNAADVDLDANAAATTLSVRITLGAVSATNFQIALTTTDRT